MKVKRQHSFYGGLAFDKTEQTTTIHLDNFSGSVVIYCCPNGFKFDLDGIEYVSDRVRK